MKLFDLVHLSICLDDTSMESSPFLWSCYPDASFQTVSNILGELNIIHSRADKFKVYEVTVSPFDNSKATPDRPYRWIDPEYRKAFLDENKERNIDPKIAWDDVMYVDLDVEADIIQKAEAILKGVPYDRRVMMDVDLSNDMFLKIAKLAHEKDITINQMIGDILALELAKYESENL